MKMSFYLLPEALFTMRIDMCIKAYDRLKSVLDASYNHRDCSFRQLLPNPRRPQCKCSYSRPESSVHSSSDSTEHLMPIPNDRDRKENKKWEKQDIIIFWASFSWTLWLFVVVLFSRFRLLNWEWLACQRYAPFSKGLPLSLPLNTWCLQLGA